MWIQPIFDRTQIDVDYAKKNRNNSEHLKGAQNYSDWERLTGNMYYLADNLNKQGYFVQIICRNIWNKPAPSNPKIEDIPTYNEIKQIKDDIDKLRLAYYTMNSTPLTPDLPLNHFEKINDMEKILFDINKIFENMLISFNYCGEFYSGEMGFI